MYDSARYKMATPASTFGYVAILSKPWNMQSTTAVDVNASIQLVLYSGTFTEQNSASIIDPIARGRHGIASRCNRQMCGVAWQCD